MTHDPIPTPNRHRHYICDHALAYCEKCDVAYCTSCQKEWTTNIVKVQPFTSPHSGFTWQQWPMTPPTDTQCRSVTHDGIAHPA